MVMGLGDKRGFVIRAAAFGAAVSRAVRRGFKQSPFDPNGKVSGSAQIENSHIRQKIMVCMLVFFLMFISCSHNPDEKGERKGVAATHVKKGVASQTAADQGGKPGGMAIMQSMGAAGDEDYFVLKSSSSFSDVFTNVPHVSVTGSVKGAKPVVKIGGKAAPVDAKGDFKISIALKPGENVKVFEYVDKEVNVIWLICKPSG
jgi:hypothetical protein